MDEAIKKAVLDEISTLTQKNIIRDNKFSKIFLITFSLICKDEPLRFEFITEDKRNIIVKYNSAFNGLTYQLFTDIKVINEILREKLKIKIHDNYSQNIFFIEDKNGMFDETTLSKIYKVGINEDINNLKNYKTSFWIFIKEVKDTNIAIKYDEREVDKNDKV